MKTGDKLVKAKLWDEGGKGKKAQFSEKEYYFLLSNGKYLLLEWSLEEQGKKLILQSGFNTLRFDWEVNLANAMLLQQISVGSSSFGLPITLKSFAKLKKALRNKFPNSLRDESKIKIEAPHLVGEGKTRLAVFQGLGFDDQTNSIFKYEFEIGNEIYLLSKKNLVIGPRYVEYEEFYIPPKDEDLQDEDLPEGWNIGITANRPFVIPPTPEEAAKARAEYNQMVAFQVIVTKFLTKPKRFVPGSE